MSEDPHEAEATARMFVAREMLGCVERLLSVTDAEVQRLPDSLYLAARRRYLAREKARLEPAAFPLRTAARQEA